MVPGPDGVNICSDCAGMVVEMASNAERMIKGGPDSAKGAAGKPSTPPLGPVPSPREIKAFLDKYVIGHDETKRMLSVAVHNH